MSIFILSGLGLGLLTISGIALAFKWYKIVPSSQAHLVIYGSGGRKVFSSDSKFQSQNAGSSYFSIPNFVPIFGRVVRALDVTIKELIFTQETYEKDQARYMVTSSTKYRVVDVQKASESFIDESELKTQLKEIIQAAVREVTVKYDVINARAKKQLMSDEIKKSICCDLENWGVELVNFVLVDFQDTENSKIISDISKRREVEIQSTTREQNAEKLKQARIKEAEADEKAKQREIERDRTIGEQEQIKAQKISEKEKEAKSKEYEVIKVQTIKQAEIDKEKAIIEANQKKEQEEILKHQKELEGQGNRLRDEQIAIGKAAEIKEKLLAEAEGKEKLQEALNKFTEQAIIALTAQQQIEASKDVGVALAEAFQKSDMRVFCGSDNNGGFDLGKMLSSASVSNDSIDNALLSRIGIPNNVGFTGLGLEKAKELKETKKEDNKKSDEIKNKYSFNNTKKK